jgi:hypothetical protein
MKCHIMTETAMTQLQHHYISLIDESVLDHVITISTKCITSNNTCHWNSMSVELHIVSHMYALKRQLCRKLISSCWAGIDTCPTLSQAVSTVESKRDPLHRSKSKTVTWYRGPLCRHVIAIHLYIQIYICVCWCLLLSTNDRKWPHIVNHRFSSWYSHRYGRWFWGQFLPKALHFIIITHITKILYLEEHISCNIYLALHQTVLDHVNTISTKCMTSHKTCYYGNIFMTQVHRMTQGYRMTQDSLIVNVSGVITTYIYIEICVDANQCQQMTESDLHMILASRAAVESEDNFYQKQCTECHHTYLVS